jgi:hypothetical protein
MTPVKRATLNAKSCCSTIKVGDRVYDRMGLPVGPKGANSYRVLRIDHVAENDGYYLYGPEAGQCNDARAMHLHPPR